MESKSIDSLLNEASKAAHLSTTESVRAFDGVLGELSAQMTPELVRPVLLLLIDDVDYEEAQMTAVAVAESAKDPNYVIEFIAVLPELHAKAPKWAARLLIRILNLESAKNTMLDCLRSAPDGSREAITLVRKGIVEEYGDEPRWRFEMPLQIVKNDLTS